MNNSKFRKRILLLIIVLTVLSCKKAVMCPSIQVSNMVCEYLTNPIGIDILSPLLSWQLKTEDIRGEKQTAYRIIVASSTDKLSADIADFWDTGKVYSNQSNNITYQGKSLYSRMKCYWKVMVWDKDGIPSSWSEPAFWTMGLLNKEDWKAQWIGFPGSNTSPYFRHSFFLNDAPKHAFVYLASLGYFELFINGEKVGNDVLAPAVSNFSKRTYYKTYNVAKYLLEGKNSIAIWMGTGWYSPGLPGVNHSSPVVRAQLEILDGETISIITNSSWETKASDRSLIGEWRWGKFGGERLDARLVELQWWDNEKSINDWKPAVLVKPSEVLCTAQKCRNNIRLAEITPKLIEKLDDTTTLIDFGTNLTGMFNLKMYKLRKGQKVTIHYADLDGRLPEDAWRLNMDYKGFATYNQRDEYISAGNNEDYFHNKFNYHGYRYAIVEGLKYTPKKEDMIAIPVETEIPEVGTFSCSNELYNRIHKMTRWTYRALNLGGQTVDCPHRERVGYGDGQTIMDVGCFNFDASTLYAKWSENWWDEQENDGFVPFVAPTPHATGGGPAWGAMSIVVPWKTYLFYNNKRLLQTGYPHMKKYIEFLNSHSVNGILKDIFPNEKWSNLGDWVPPGRGMDKEEWVDNSSRKFFNNCYRIYLLDIMSKVGKILDKMDDVSEFNNQKNIAQKAVHHEWFNTENNSYANGEQPYLIFPLLTEVTPKDLKEDVFNRFINTMMVIDKGHLNSGMVGTQIVFDYLLENNRSDLIDIMVNKRSYPSWGYMLEKGATTCWEQWNGYYSQIHSCFPYIGSWFYRGLAGISWDEENPGFKNVILRPNLVKSVEWVNCNYNSPYGKITSNWKVKNKILNWEVTVPPNSTVKIYIPGKYIKIDGKDAFNNRHVNYICREDDNNIFAFESGRYNIVSKL